MHTFEKAKLAFEKKYFKELFNTYPNAPLMDLMKISGIKSSAQFYRMLDRIDMRPKKEQPNGT